MLLKQFCNTIHRLKSNKMIAAGLKDLLVHTTFFSPMIGHVVCWSEQQFPKS